MQQPAISLGSFSEMTVGIKLNREVHMIVGNKNQNSKSTMSLIVKLTFKLRILVAAVVGCLLVAPLTRAYKPKIRYR